MSTETETAIEVTEEEQDLDLKNEGRRSEESEAGPESVDDVAVVIESETERREVADAKETAVEVEDVDGVAA